MDLNFTKLMPYMNYLISGLYIVLLLSGVAAFFGSILGILAALLIRKNRFPGKIVRAIVDFFRGTPVLFQLSFFYLALPQIIPNFTPGPYLSGFIIFSLNSGAYLSEVFRAGIESVDIGQIEAAHSLGVSSRDINLYIIFPQAVRTILPSLFNEFIALTKETSVVSVIGIADLMRRSQVISGRIFRYFEPLLIVGIIYYILNVILSHIGRLIEKRLKYD